jgi:hypothetical protein
MPNEEDKKAHEEALKRFGGKMPPGDSVVNARYVKGIKEHQIKLAAYKKKGK